MADINKIKLYDTIYNIEDEVSRNYAESAVNAVNSVKKTADSALSKANSNTSLINNAKREIPVIAYNSSEQQIEITKGV